MTVAPRVRPALCAPFGPPRLIETHNPLVRWTTRAAQACSAVLRRGPAIPGPLAYAEADVLVLGGNGVLDALACLSLVRQGRSVIFCPGVGLDTWPYGLLEEPSVRHLVAQAMQVVLLDDDRQDWARAVDGEPALVWSRAFGAAVAQAMAAAPGHAARLDETWRPVLMRATKSLQLSPVPVAAAPEEKAVDATTRWQAGLEAAARSTWRGALPRLRFTRRDPQANYLVAMEGMILTSTHDTMGAVTPAPAPQQALTFLRGDVPHVARLGAARWLAHATDPKGKQAMVRMMVDDVMRLAKMDASTPLASLA